MKLKNETDNEKLINQLLMRITTIVDLIHPPEEAIIKQKVYQIVL